MHKSPKKNTTLERGVDNAGASASGFDPWPDVVKDHLSSAAWFLWEKIEH